MSEHGAGALSRPRPLGGPSKHRSRGRLGRAQALRRALGLVRVCRGASLPPIGAAVHAAAFVDRTTLGETTRIDSARQNDSMPDFDLLLR
ncbi:MAG: hypothetical protein MUC86_08815, partial [Burkholderiaceae bacterium]|nr:hypothetical protein [Burkholderiaceae bacterium]